MKKIICLLSIAVLTTSVQVAAQKKYMTFSGKITDKNSDTLMVRSRKFSKIIIVKNDGSFADTLKVEKGYYNLSDGKESTKVFLENGFNLKMTLDTKEFDETIKYSGIGAEPNNYLAKNFLLVEEVQNNESLYSLPKADFDKKITSINKNWKLELHKAKKLDPAFVAEQIKSIDGFTAYISGSYEKTKYMNEVLAKGKLSPKFKNFENNAGGTTSLDDLKGKYVYIDVWATWCGPCKAEIPALKAVEKEYHDKNIAFVSISADKIKAHDAWKKMVKDMDLSGIQLFSDNDFNTSFMKEYQIDAIPRFILLDPKGNIIAADAPRPSDKKLIDLFKELKI
jgi:thiol-disulfide isomerase/thioredoxin